MKELLDLYWTFFKIGGTSFGGGYAMLPTLEKVIAEKKGWATSDELGDYFAIGQCTPGIIAVNVATFIGMKYRGVSGAVTATLGLVSPCVVIITALGALISQLSGSALFASVFRGMEVCVAVLIAGSAQTLVKKAVVNTITRNICLLVCLLTLSRSLANQLPQVIHWLTSPVALVIACGFIGSIGKGEKSKKI